MVAFNIKSPRIYRGQNGGFGNNRGLGCYLLLQELQLPVLQELQLPVPQELQLPVPQELQLPVLQELQLQSVAPATPLIQFGEPKTGP